MDGVMLLRPGRDPNPPHGGTLVNLQVSPERAAELKAAARDFISLDLNPRQLCDLEMLATGAFSPLTGFMGRADYEQVCSSMRLADGTLWPVPVTLNVPLATAERLAAGQKVALRDIEGTMIAVLTVAEIWRPDKVREAEALYGTSKPTHPEANYLLNVAGEACVAGTIEVVELSARHDFLSFRGAPAALRAAFQAAGTHLVLAYQTHKAMHRAHVEFTRNIARAHNAHLLIQGVVGKKDLGETTHYARARALRAVLDRYPPDGARLNLLDLSTRQCGPRATLWHAIINKNYGCTHFVVGHDHHDLGEYADGAPVYGRFQGLELAARHEDELGVRLVPMRNLIYEEDHPEHFLVGRTSQRHVSVPDGHSPFGRPERGHEIAQWFSYPAVLRQIVPPRQQQGITLFFTGLSGSGKSTVAQVLVAKLMEVSSRPVTLLDGDVVRKHLSSELGFTREHRDLNILRLGYVSSLIASHGGIVICAPIAPYAQTRAQVRGMIEQHGIFIEVYVATPIAMCETRDRKGLYARARAGLIKNFTGVSDPYEAPTAAEIAIDTSNISPQQAADDILAYLFAGGLIEPPADAADAGHRAPEAQAAPRTQRPEAEPRPAR